MGRTKRSRKAAGSSGSSKAPPVAAAAAADDDDSEISTLLVPLLRRLQEWNDSEQLSAALTDLLDGKSLILQLQDTESTSKKRSSASDAEVHLLGHWLVLATVVMERLITLNDEESMDTAAISAALAYQVSRLLLIHKSKLDRMANSNAKHVLGRALLAATAASLRALSVLSMNAATELSGEALLLSVLGLDQLVHFQGTNTTIVQNFVDNKSGPPPAASQQVCILWHWIRKDWEESVLFKDMEEWNQVCGRVEQQLPDVSNEIECLQALLSMEQTSGTSTSLSASSDASNTTTGLSTRRGSASQGGGSRTSKKAKTETPLEVLQASFASLLSAKHNNSTSNIKIDGRLAVRRWACVALVWPCQGQDIMLRAMDGILAQADQWSQMLESKNRRGRETETSAPGVTVPGNVQLVALMSRLARVIMETGTSCGTRAPTGGVDSYMMAIWPGNGASGGKKKSKASTAKLVRPDVRNVTMAVVYKLIQVHADCLERNLENNTAGLRIVDDFGFASSVDPGAMMYSYYPFLDFAINDLAGAASSSVANSDYSEQTDWAERINCTAAAFVFQRQAQEAGALDAKLTRFSVGKLMESLRNMEREKPESGDGTKKEWSLEKPLPIPQISEKPVAAPRKKKKKKSSGDSSAAKLFCSFGGVLERPMGKDKSANPVTPKLSGDEILSLFIRCIEARPASENTAGLLSHLIRIVESCYDTRVLEDLSPVRSQASADQDAAIPAKKRKSETTTARKTKKRKKGNEPPVPEYEIVGTSGAPSYKPIKVVRAGLAAETLDVLQAFLLSPTGNAVFSDLRLSLRKSLSVDHIQRIVDLGRGLDEIIVRPRTSPQAIASSEADAAQADDKAVADVFVTSTFPHHEKKLWTSHMKMSQALGRGALSFDQTRKPILEDVRSQMFRMVASSCRDDRVSDETAWPLWLPAAHRALVACNLTSEPIISEHVDGDRFIVNGFLSSITAVLENPSWLSKSGHSSSQILSLDDDIPLSFHDARIFLAAIVRLPIAEQKRALSSLLDVVQSSMCWLKDDAEALDALRREHSVSAFVARVITLCTNLTILAYSRTALDAELVRVVGMTDSTQLPCFRSGADWYRPETCFMGLFGDWESTTLPNITLPPGDTIDDKTTKQLQSILEMVFSLGFVSASVDHCHLLFGAWNALGKSGIWMRDPTDVQVPSALPEDIPLTILELRRDVCFVHRLIRMIDGGTITDSSLLRAIDNKEAESSSASASKTWSLKAKAVLRNMVRKASRLIDHILQAFFPDDEDLDQDIPPEVFALMEALAVYLSFSISVYTKPKNDFFSPILASARLRSHGRARGYSSDSENIPSDTESIDSQDALYDAVERLQEVCDAFGAVPAFPDWLDLDCQLRDTLTFDEAIESALEAQRSLSKLVTIGLARAQKSEKRALDCVSDTRGNIDRRSELASKLCKIQHYNVKNSSFGDGPYSGERDLSADISSVCGVDTNCVKLLLSDDVTTNRECAIGSWCPNSAQRILGRFQSLFRTQQLNEQDIPELRAAGEWEVLLSVTLTSSCIRVPPPKNMSARDQDRDAFIEQGARWLGVSDMALSCLTSVAALLRFGLCGVGRKPHPLSQPDMDIGTWSTNGVLIEDLPTEMRSSEKVKATVTESLITISQPVVDTFSKPIAAHLMHDPSHFSVLYAMEVIQFALTTLADLQEVLNSSKTAALEGASHIIERLAAVVECYGRSGSENSQNCGQLTRLLATLGVQGVLHVNSIVEPKLDPLVAFTTVDSSSYLRRDENFTRAWVDENVNRKAVGEMMSLLLTTSSYVNRQTRSFFCCALSSVALLEHELLGKATKKKPVLLPLIVKALNSTANHEIKNLIELEIGTVAPIDKNVVGERSDNMRNDLCLLLAFALAAEKTSFVKASLILSTLESTFDQWNMLGSVLREPILNLLLLYGCRCDNKLFGIGSKLVSKLGKSRQTSTSGSSTALENLSTFTLFIRGLRTRLFNSSKGQSPMSITTESPSPLDDPLLDSCSYARNSGFSEQHWYNCYTCGLTWDKGCCTVCALVCHRGHDVSYSRFSSFFCDCGADEESGETARDRSSCKCRLPLSREDKATALAQGGLVSAVGKGEEVSYLCPALCADIAKQSFEKQTRQVLESVIQQGRNDKWTHSLFESTREEFSRWKSQLSYRTMPDAQLEEVSYEKLRRELLQRKGRSVNVERLDVEPFVSLRISRSCAFKTKMSTDSSTERMKRDLLSTNGMDRSIVVADSRGRLVIGEPNSLLFCSGLPMVNVRHHQLGGVCFPRASMCIMGSKPIDFNIVGLKLSTDDESHLIVWGTTEATVFTLDEMKSQVIDSVGLAVNLPSPENGDDYIVKCQWIPGSSSGLVVGCSRMIRVFDLNSSSFPATPVETVTMGFDASVRDVVVVHVGAHGVNNTWKLFVLLNNGELHSVGLTLSEKRIITTSDTKLLQSTAISLSTEAESLPSSRRGTRLAYLEQSGMLLYQSSLAGVHAFMLRSNGKIEGRFELLPDRISSDILGSQADGYDVCGPYRHWTELGVACREESEVFRVACVGTRTTTNEPALLCLEFNSTQTNVKELVWNPKTLGLCSAFEGITAFSAPYVYREMACSDVRSERKFVERVFLSAITSTGTLLTYAENIGSSARPAIDEEEYESNGLFSSNDSIQSRTEPSFPLTAFEALENIPEDKISFAGDGMGCSDEIRRKLSLENDSFLMSRSQDGFTLAVLLNKKVAGDHPSEFASNCLNDDEPKQLVVAAIRVLVGATSTECIPRKILIEGRPVELIAGTKKWYSLHLTAEEISLAVRNGFVSLGITQPFDSYNNPLIDAVEVYGIKRDVISEWLPKALRSIASRDMDTLDAIDRARHAQTAHPDGSFLLSLRALSCLCDMLGFVKPFKPNDELFLKEVVQECALSRDQKVLDSVEELLVCFEPDEDARNSLRDAAVLRGCSAFLAHCKQVFEAIPAGSDDEFLSKWKALRSPLRDCLRVAARIARCRQMNYLHAFDGKASIAADASKFIHECLSRCFSDDDLVSGFVELSLLEMAIAVVAGPGHNSHGRLGTFDGLRKLLSSSNQSVIDLACRSISRFCEKYSAADSSDEQFFLFAPEKMVVHYQCDSCKLFPISDVRYEGGDEDSPFDLCQECFRAGTTNAAANNFSERKDVVINGKTVGAEKRLTCAEVKLLKPVAIPKPSTSSETEQDPQIEDDEDEEEKQLQRALRLSLPDGGGAEVLQRQQLFDEFTNNLFSGVIGLLSRELGRSQNAPLSLIHLAVDLIRRSDQSGRQVDRAKRLSKELTLGLSRSLKAATELIAVDGITDDWKLTVFTFIQALTDLAAQDSVIREYLTGLRKDPEVGQSGSTKITCDVHGAPVVRRKCTEGKQKDREYFTCGASHRRCNYFSWADQTIPRADKNAGVQSLFNEAVAEHVWTLLCSSQQNPTALHIALCSFLDKFILNDSLLFDASSSSRSRRMILKGYGRGAARTDFLDGVLCSRERLEDVEAENLLLSLSHRVRDDWSAKPSFVDGDRLTMEASLELLVLVAGGTTDDISSWFSLLCEIILTADKTARLRALAKRALVKLCGQRRDLYLAVRDHHVFGFHFQKLIKATERRLETCLLLKEKARQCGPHWRSKESFKWRRLTFGDLLGTEGLISEDVMTLESYEATNKFLSELRSVAKKRGDNWRRFCSLRLLPKSRHCGSVCELSETPPIACLTWIACSLNGSNLVKVLNLLDLALTRSTDRKKPPENAPRGSSSDEENGLGDSLGPREPISLPGVILSSPEEILTVTVDDAHAFVMRFVCRGSTAEIRRVACNVAAKLCNTMKTPAIGQLFQRFLGSALCQSGVMGKNLHELMALLQNLAKRAGRTPSVGSFASLIQQYWKQQVLAVRHDRANGEYVTFETRINTVVQRKRFDLSCCAHCHKIQHPAPKDSDTATNQSGTQSSSQGASTSRTTAASRTSTSSSTATWLLAQISAPTRGRLNVGRESRTSNEFNTFFSLKCRLAVSEIYAEVNDPRGRYVKTITIYFSPRPVEDANMLKADEYSDRWQRCGSMSLSRGATRASCKLSKPVVAANIKIEYTDFYERPGGSKASDGSLLVHCPRCTRVVTNAHGVCGSCGEVAFQCRKCRHINYDRLDAFLCVECGYCSSGTYSFELVAGVASNAIAITNDKDYERSVEMMALANRLHDDLRSVLREKLLALTRNKNKMSTDTDNGGSMLMATDQALERAFDGALPLPPGQREDAPPLNLPLDKLGNRGSIVKAVARAELSSTNSVSSAGERLQSLLRMARELRTDSDADRRRSGEVIIRHLGRESDTATGSELLQLLNIAGGGGLTGLDDLDDDPVSRLLASVQNRREQQQERDDQEGPGENDGEGGTSATNTATTATAKKASNNSMATKADLDTCERLYILMREAERESYALNHRIQAWKRLERDQLADTGNDENIGAPPRQTFDPSHCSVCAGTTALDLLTLWLRLFQANPSKVVIDKDLIVLLLSDDSNLLLSTKSYQDQKRVAVKEIALKSTQGSEIVLEELRLRLHASQDPNCAEILGQILESDGAVKQPFVDLAMEVLEQSHEWS